MNAWIWLFPHFKTPLVFTSQKHYRFFLLNPIYSQIETENFAKFKEFPSKCSWDARSTDKTDGFTARKKNTMLSTMSLERRSNKIIIICTCIIVQPLVQELPEGFWTQPVKLAVRTSPTWRADRYQGTAAKTARPVLSIYPKRDGTFNQTKENFLLT